MKRALVTLGVLCAALLGWIGWSAYSFLKIPPSREGQTMVFDVAQGASFTQIANELQKKGLVTDARKLRWLARYRKLDNKLQAGRFSLNSAWTPDEILDALVVGRPELYRVTIPEGFSWWQTAALLEREGFVKFEDFKNAIHDPAFLRRFGIPFDSAEGFLMPDTYLFKKPDFPASAGEEEKEKIWAEQSRNIAGRLADNFWRKADPIWGGKKENRPDSATLKKLTIIASIVEKETGIASERARVAGVYSNRLEKNMRLQADPTVAYGLGQSFKGPLRRSQLDDSDNPYNTYQRDGLPPGPICSFGAAALKAAAEPEKHDFLYFVARTDGGEHQFSRGLDEHNRAVEAYRRQKRNR